MLERNTPETTIAEDGRIVSNWQLTEDANSVVSIHETVSGDAVSICLDGKLRSDTTQFLRDELMLLAVTGANIQVNCRKLSYMANNCKKALIEVQQLMDKIRHGSLFLQEMPREIYAEFKTMGLIGALEVEEAK